MLSAMRRNAQSWVIKTVLLVVAATFVIGFGAFAYVGRSIKTEGAGQFVAKVNGTAIGVNEYRNELRARENYYRQLLGDNYDSFAPNLNLKQQTLNALIDRVLLMTTATQLGLAVSDEELRRRIYETPRFQRGGAFNKEVYENALKRYQLTTKEYEAGLRESLLLSKAEDLIVGFVKVADDEVRADYELNARKSSFSYVAFSADDFGKSIEITDEEARAYFEAHRDEFRVPEKRRARILTVNQADLAADIEITEEQIQQHYIDNRDRLYTEKEQVQASHILRRLAPDAGEELKQKTRELAEDLLRRAREGADFDKMAADFSEDETTKDRGGDLGYFERGRMQKPFEDAAFALDVGEVGGVVETSYGLHIIKVTDKKTARVKPIEEVSDEIRMRLENEEAAKAAKTLIDQIHASLAPGTDLVAAAQGRNNVSVELSDLVTSKDRLPEVDGGWQVVRILFDLTAVGQISEPVAGRASQHLVELETIEPEHDAAFEEVQDDAAEKAKAKKQTALAAQEADALLAAAKESTLAEAAAGRGLTVSQTGLVALRGDAIAGVGTDGAVKRTLFDLTREKPLAAEPYAIGGRVFVFELLERQMPSDEGFDAVKEELRDRLRTRKENERRRLWRENAVQQATIEYGPDFANLL